MASADVNNHLKEHYIALAAVMNNDAEQRGDRVAFDEHRSKQETVTKMPYAASEGLRRLTNVLFSTHVGTKGQVCRTLFMF